MIKLTIVLFLTRFIGDNINGAESETGIDVWMITGLAVGAMFFICGILLIAVLYKRC